MLHANEFFFSKIIHKIWIFFCSFGVMCMFVCVGVVFCCCFLFFWGYVCVCGGGGGIWIAFLFLFLFFWGYVGGRETEIALNCP